MTSVSAVASTSSVIASRRATSALSRCSCQQMHARAASTATSSSSKTTHPVRPARGWTLPNFAALKRAANLPAPRPQKFENKIALPNDGSLTIFSPTPRPHIAITRDTSNNPLWAFASSRSAADAAAAEDDGGRMGKFARKFGGQNRQNTEPVVEKPAQSITTAQAKVAESMGKASGGSGNTKQAVAAAEKVAQASASKKATPAKAGKGEQVKAATPEQQPQQDTQMEMFDLTLEGEVYEESRHKIVEDSSKKAKKGGKKGKK